VEILKAPMRAGSGGEAVSCLQVNEDEKGIMDRMLDNRLE